ncbi:aminodeoxychorismate synthase, component I [Lysobacteraceae bacterium NML120232]|nr:aminodeoxychorismate synthase, component I [Xanthomonadaceae bacterium NML120232]
MVRTALDAGLDLAALRRVCPQRYPLLLTSSAAALDASTRQLAAWDMLLVTDGRKLVQAHDGRLGDETGKPLPGGFLAALDACWQAERSDIASALRDLPFRGGWALFLGYEVAAEIEPHLQLPAPRGRLPRAQAWRCPVAVLRHHPTGEICLVAEPGAESLRDAVLADIAAIADLPALPDWQVPEVLHEDAPEAFIDAVQKAQDYLAAGDVFQVNLSRGWQAGFAAPLDPAQLARQLASANPAPFAGVLADQDWAVVSASPERLISVRGEMLDTRPIAGTCPRLAGDDEAARVRELVGHPKERAEHIMLVDLARNDLGRIAQPGSVEVSELMTVESYAHVHHIVSNVRARRQAGISPVEVIGAVFPGGSITGAPKVRCMQIIAGLEQVGRSAYTGAMGWLNRDGDMDLNILIRSAELEGRQLRFRTGAGIVMDSVPQKELQETRAKARGMLRALGLAE